MKALHALAAGFAGAIALTVTHQVLHRIIDEAPRMDLMGEEALTILADRADVDLPAENQLYNITMAGDIIGNTLYYAIAAAGDHKNALPRGLALGLLAGAGGVVLPKHLGLNNSYSDRTMTTKLLTVAIYTLGGLVSGKIASVLGRKTQ